MGGAWRYARGRAHGRDDDQFILDGIKHDQAMVLTVQDANGNTLEFMNILQLSTGTGVTDIWYISMPNDAKALIPNTGV